MKRPHLCDVVVDAHPRPSRTRDGHRAVRWLLCCDAIGGEPYAGMEDFAYRNAHVSVQFSTEPSAWGDITHLWIRRHDGAMTRSWASLQRIKDELVGEERVAVEVFPARSQLVDAAPMHHLWVLPIGMVLPFSLRAGDA